MRSARPGILLPTIAARADYVRRGQLVVERIRQRAELQLQTVVQSAQSEIVPAPTAWQQHLPDLRGKRVTLRALSTLDAPALLALLTTEEVVKFISPPPPTLEGFERFVGWAARQQSAGSCFCYGITLTGYQTAIGVIQVRLIDGVNSVAEWGFALGSPFWGTEVFMESAQLVLDFLFDGLRVNRLEARAAVQNGRGNGVLNKLGAVQEGVLRRSFLRSGQYLDQVLYAIVADEWRHTRIHLPLVGAPVH